MKILHVEGGFQFYGGAFQVFQLIKGLHAQGQENFLVCPHGCALAAAAAPFARVYPLSMHGDLDVLLILRLINLIRVIKPHLIHLHSRIGADVMGGIAGRLTNLPVIHTRRVDNPEPRWLATLKYRLHDRVIAISAAIGTILLANGLSATKLRVVRSAIPWEDYAQPVDPTWVRNQLQVPQDAVLIGMIAQLIPRKGHQILLAALPPLIKQYPQLHVCLFGQGPLVDLLMKLIKNLGLIHHVQLLGFRSDLAKLLPGFDLIIHPAIMEGLGVSILQAASAGVAIIASQVGGIPEVIQDGVTGLLFPPGDTEALQTALKKLLADPAQRKDLGAAAQARMARDFSIDAMVKGNLEVYLELASDN